MFAGSLFQMVRAWYEKDRCPFVHSWLLKPIQPRRSYQGDSQQQQQQQQQPKRKAFSPSCAYGVPPTRRPAKSASTRLAEPPAAIILIRFVLRSSSHHLSFISPLAPNQITTAETPTALASTRRTQSSGTGAGMQNTRFIRLALLSARQIAFGGKRVCKGDHSLALSQSPPIG